MKVRGGKGAPGLEQHEAGVRSSVYVELVILVIPLEATPRLADGDIALPVRLHDNIMNVHYYN